jgi:hypothetical protein
MFARLLAIVICLWATDPRPGRAEPASQPAREVVVYLQTARGQPSEPIEEMTREVDALMAAAGYTVSWRVVGVSTGDAVDASLAVIELRGVCQAPQSAGPVEFLSTGASLASTAIVDGKVLPYSQVECENLSRLVAVSLAREAAGKRQHLYGRAMGRLVAHELFHVLVGTRDHDGAGIAKRSFSAKDVLAEHFVFELTALDKFRDSASERFRTAGENSDSAARRR